MVGILLFLSECCVINFDILVFWNPLTVRWLDEEAVAVGHRARAPSPSLGHPPVPEGTLRPEAHLVHGTHALM